MLNAGLVSILVVDKHKADLWTRVFPKVKAHDAIAVRTGGDIAWAVRKASPELKAFLDGVATAATSGNLAKERERIFTRYLKTLVYVKNAASAEERRKFLALIDYFRKYGDRYDVDWLLMAAQGYQESALNQDARSHVGAVGVMQLMPATGKELNVGDIAQAEANIHAGVKYMRYMIDQYYEKEPMTKLDKALFAFASYNAGAGRVSGLRREAAKRGLDPNVWFHNVEYVAADKVGQETVTYVSNIYKYYIAYRLTAGCRAGKAAGPRAGPQGREAIGEREATWRFARTDAVPVAGWGDAPPRFFSRSRPRPAARRRSRRPRPPRPRTGASSRARGTRPARGARSRSGTGVRLPSSTCAARCSWAGRGGRARASAPS